MTFISFPLVDLPDPVGQNVRRVRQGDTNIVTVKFDKLVAPSNMHAGDPQACSNCGAILSKISKLDVLAEEKVCITHPLNIFSLRGMVVSFKYGILFVVCLLSFFMYFTFPIYLYI